MSNTRYVTKEGPYQEFFEGTPVALVRTDLKTGEFIMANDFAAHMLGFESVEDLKKSVRTVDLYPEEERKALIQRLKREKNIQDHEVKFEINGKTLWVSANLRLNCGGTCIEGAFRDITPHVLVREKHLKRLRDLGQKLAEKLESSTA